MQRILILGASGLIGLAIASDLAARGFVVIAVARRFTAAQRHALTPDLREIPVADYDAMQLKHLVDESAADVVVNCLGALQDRPGQSLHAVHDAFVDKLVTGMRATARPVLLVHLSIPGDDADDQTNFSRSKREADRRIAASGLSYAILRPGFVLAPAAYGGSALLRALAAWPVDLPQAEMRRPFAAIAVEDIAETVAVLAQRFPAQKPAAIFDLMHPDEISLGDVLGTLRRWLGLAPYAHVTMPKFLLDLGARLGDLVSLMGWGPPVRSTALAELRRGVTGDPAPWMAATGIAPRSLATLLKARPADVQEKWFARLLLLKPLIIGILVAFWCLSGLIALTVAYRPAVAILTSHGYSDLHAQAITIVSSLLDISVGLAIAFRRSCRVGLLTGVAVSLFYMIGAAIITPELWIEPLGALVKTGPAIVLMLVAFAMLEER
jgi:uncharacterized protein YbjT (DUF2867 family)